MDKELLTLIASVGTNLATIIGGIIAIVKAIRLFTDKREKTVKIYQTKIEDLTESINKQEKQIAVLTANLEREQRKRLHIRDKRDEEI